MTRFCIDYDSTLAATDLARLEALNAQFGTNYVLSDITDWNWTAENYPEEHETWQWGPECFMNEEFQYYVPSVPGAIEGVQALLHAGHQAIIISDRPDSLFDVTRAWLDERGLGTVRLFFTRHKASLSTGTTGLTKQQAVVLFKLTEVVDDGPHHAEMFASKPHIERVFLLDRPYNQEVDHPKIIRVSGWDEITSRIVEPVYA